MKLIKAVITDPKYFSSLRKFDDSYSNHIYLAIEKILLSTGYLLVSEYKKIISDICGAEHVDILDNDLKIVKDLDRAGWDRDPTAHLHVDMNADKFIYTVTALVDDPK